MRVSPRKTAGRALDEGIFHGREVLPVKAVGARFSPHVGEERLCSWLCRSTLADVACLLHCRSTLAVKVSSWLCGREVLPTRLLDAHSMAASFMGARFSL